MWPEWPCTVIHLLLMNISIYRVFKGETITVTGSFQCTQAEMYKLLEKHGAKKGKLYYSSQLLTRFLSLKDTSLIRPLYHCRKDGLIRGGLLH